MYYDLKILANDNVPNKHVGRMIKLQFMASCYLFVKVLNM